MIQHLSTQEAGAFRDIHANLNPSANAVFSRNALADPQRVDTAMVIGEPGSGKDFNIILPNLLQMNGSYFVIDPAGDLYRRTADMFSEGGYSVKTLNLLQPEKSTPYNPFNYTKSDEDVAVLVRCFMESTNSTNHDEADPFWKQSETTLLTALASYFIGFQNKERQNFAMIAELFHETKTNPEVTMHKLDAVFDEVRASDEHATCVKQYDIFKQAPEKTANAILASMAARLVLFKNETVRNLTSSDQMELEAACDTPTVIYVIVPQGANPYSFLVSMLVSQILDVISHHVQAEYGEPKYRMHMMLNEFANLGVMPELPRKLIAVKGSSCSCMLFIQAVPQLKNLYGSDWVILMDICDILVYLGGNESCTITELPQIIRSMCEAESNVEDLGIMDHNCVVCIRGYGVFVDDKYPAKEHPNFDKVNNP